MKQIVFFLLLSALIVIPRAILITKAHSETIDEEYHLLRGVEFLKRDPGLASRELDNPPAGAALSTLPLWLLGADSHGSVEGTVLYGQRFTPETARLVVAIWKSVLFLPILLLVFCWCRQLYGTPSAWLAGCILLFEPTIVGHLHLAALDVLETGAILLACWTGWRLLESPSRWRLIACAFASAAALLIKHTGIIVPVILTFYAILFAWRSREWRPIALLLLLGLVIPVAIWVLLLCDISPLRSGYTLPGGMYLQSILHATQHASAADDAFLGGEIRRGGWWYYFPALALYKVPIGVALILFCAVVSLRFHRLRRDELCLLIPAILYFAFIMSQRLNIGWRHALSGYVLLIMWASRYMNGRSWHVLVCALAAFSVAVDGLRYHPDYLVYTNWPRERVYESISDSNVDWGQGLKQARGWIDAHSDLIKGRTVWLRTFRGTNRAAAHYLGDRASYIRDARFAPDRGLLIISPAALVGLSEAGNTYAFLRSRRPIAVIGHSLLVYDLDERSSKNAP